ncbi:FAD-binding oxidoreductase [Kordiimonas sp. SCSIO 12603]|uniref:NAD(P)/FAD-dependent oxidoreductase n=1 Tax=Kordiimonas sp. SCSIO 12603 TaxID=2829596 RepID=UPI0021069945|nr:FAD-binding oxidoreductase [Kordiimonas sp. SCSIO 12603]UTW59844.1 FAD-binding oxidoreductase [Kordiimonas sp. SCSIO 12603]
MLDTEFLVIGGGIAGAGVAYFLAPHAKVMLLDMEAQAGYHTTGRSAAFYAETYGGPLLQPLTTASKAFLLSPPVEVSEIPVLTQMGAIHVMKEEQRSAAENLLEEMKELPGVRELSVNEVLERAPHLDKTQFTAGVNDPECGNLDVATLHQGYLRAAKKMGLEVRLEDGFESAEFKEDHWLVKTRKGQITARTLINASGAWADDVAIKAHVQPLKLKPLRRTIVTIPSPEGLPFEKNSPVVIDVEESFYFKPEGAGYLVSPADETLSPACDAQPELEDIAMAVEHFQNATGSTVEKIEAKWAGLRTFAKDKAPVIGYDENQPNFFWNVGQGGYGIQTSPAWSELAANLAMGNAVPEHLRKHGVKAEPYRPARLLD